MKQQQVNISTLAALGLMAGFVVAGTAVLNQSVAAQEGRSQEAVSLPEEKTVGKLEPVVAFTGSMPTGVTVSQDGRVFVNFPDPWFKRRHRKRRLMDEELARDIHRVLEPDGELLFQSDVWDIALDAMGVLDALDHLFVNAAGPWSFWRAPNPYAARSWREQHCEEASLPIWRLLYQKI